MKARTIKKAPSRGQRARQAAHAPAPDRLSPADRYQELFVAVQSGGVFDDSKTFVDCAPPGEPAAILEAYRSEHRQPGLDLAAFVHRHFAPTHPQKPEYESKSGQSLCGHIDALWSVLTRHPGGLATTECASDQQWGRPNGWAPLQWMGIRGLSDYGHGPFAQEIAHRWLTTVAGVCQLEGKLVEKYAIRELSDGPAYGGGGGGYPLQDGFGRTNGATRALLAEHPEHAAHQTRAHTRAG